MSNSIPPSRAAIDIKVLLSEFDSSGQSAAAFARSHGIAPWKMYHALQRRSGKVRSGHDPARAERSALLPVHVVDAKPAQRPGALELILGGGQRVLIGSDFDALTLRRLIEALAPC